MTNPPPNNCRSERGDSDTFKGNDEKAVDPRADFVAPRTVPHPTTLSPRASPVSKPLKTLPHKLKKPIYHSHAKEANNQHQQGAAFEQPWLFQSANFYPLPLPSQWPPLSQLSVSPLTKLAESSEIANPEGDSLSLLVPLASAFTLNSSNSSPFFLDAASIKSLLPSPRLRPRPASGTYGSHSPSSGRRGNRVRKHAPARLDALILDSGRRTKKRARATTLPTTTDSELLHEENDHPLSRIAGRRKNALRINIEVDNAVTDMGLKGKKKHRKHKRRSTVRKHEHSPIASSPNNSDSEQQVQRISVAPGRESPETDQVLDEDQEEERRQKALIAAQLNLTLEEYEALDAAFGSSVQGNNDDNDDDENGNGSMTERYFHIFQQFDSDGSGAISPEELRALLLAAGEAMDDAELAAVIQQADTDHDGQVDFGEFVALMRARKRLLSVANTMGISGTGPASINNKASKKKLKKKKTNTIVSSPALPPLKSAAVPTNTPKRNAHSNPAGQTTDCTKTEALSALRRELALSEYGVQALDIKVREGMQWVQQHCPVTSLRAQIFCHRWGLEKVRSLLLRMQSQQLSRAFSKWRAFRMYERNKQRANLFLKCKGSKKVTDILAKWRRRAMRRRFAHWQRHVVNEARIERQSAALEIQRVARGKLARLRCNCLQRRIAVTRIQALTRGRQARELLAAKRHAKLEHEAACLLQRCYRGYNGKRVARALFKAQVEALAARKVQRAFRNHQRRELLRVIQRAQLENESAILVQRVIRGYFARCEKHALLAARRREIAAISIQRHVRGRLTRAEIDRMRKRESAAIEIQCFVRSRFAQRRLADLRDARALAIRIECNHRAAVSIQTRWRGAHARQNFQEEKTRRADAAAMDRILRLTASVRIQSVYRGFQARRAAKKRRFDQLKWQHFTLMNRSALIIQSFWRGYHGRLAAHLRLQAQRALDTERFNAAVAIQRFVRRRLILRQRRRRARQQAEMARALREKNSKAAVRIQKIVRGRRARKAAQERQKAHKDQAQEALERLVAQTKAKAARTIQQIARRYIARCAYLRRKEEVKQMQLRRAEENAKAHAALNVQCLWRQRQARRVLLQKRRELERRLSLMASEKARDEIERLRREQERELLALKMQLELQGRAASAERARLKEELAKEQEEKEQERRQHEAQELARLKLEAIMQRQQDEEEQEARRKNELKRQKTMEAERRREALEAEKSEMEAREAQLITQEREELARLKMAALLGTGDSSGSPTGADHELEKHKQQQLELEKEAAQLKLAAEQARRRQAEMKVQAFCLKRVVARQRLEKLARKQQEALAKIQDQEQRLRAQAEAQQELALARLKALMDDEARERERELRELETQMLERARVEKERLALRHASARKIQARARGFLGRRRVLAIQRKIEADREARHQEMENKLAAALAEVDALANEGKQTPDGECDVESGGVEEAAEGSAEDWVEYWDDNAQASYFYNVRTQEASWTRPASVGGISAKAMEIVLAATGGNETSNAQTEELAQYAADGNYYADEYGYYDQYGQYHYYDAGNAIDSNGYYTMQAQQQLMGAASMMYPNYAAAYAYQAAAAMAFGQPMMFGNPMAFANGVNPMAMTAAPNSNPVPQVADPAPDAMMALQSSTDVPPDPWEKFFDQYSGAAYYYNSLTGERYWA